MSASPHYCIYCGARNEAGSEHCVACGQLLAIEAEPELVHERYLLLAQVGVGGYGGVFRAIDTVQGGQVVAVKRINLRGLSAQEMIEATDSFNREVRLLSDLDHPNLPAVRDTFTDQHNWYLVMDFIEGETLDTYLTRTALTGLTPGEVLALGLQLCAVLEYLHSRQPPIIFRDLKPGNIMRTPDGEVYLIDFGIARHFNPNKLKDTIPFGSPGYAAPEQYGRAQTTPRADIYSLGATLHFLLTGNDPAENPFHFAPLSTNNSPLLIQLDALIQRMVAIEPLSRPRSIADVNASLLRLYDSLEGHARSVEAARQAPLYAVPAAPSGKGYTRRGLIRGAAVLGLSAAAFGAIVTLCPNLAFQLTRFHGVNGVVALPPPSPVEVSKQLAYTGHKGPITALSWSPDGTMIASGSADKTVQVWRAADGALLYTLSGYDQPVTSVVWASDRSNVIASSGMSDGTVQVWDALRDHRELIFHGDGRTLALSWRPKSPWIVSGDTDEDIYTWNATTGAKGASYRGHKGSVRAVTWLEMLGTSALPSDPRYAQIASAGADGTVHVWLSDSGKKLLIYTGHSAGVNALSLLQGAVGGPIEFIVSASDDKTVQVWRPGINQAEYIYRKHEGKVYAVATFPKKGGVEQIIISGGEDQVLRIWNPSRSFVEITFKVHNSPVKAIATSPIDLRVVSGDEDGLIQLWTASGLSHGSS